MGGGVMTAERLCAGCGVVILPKAERVALEDTDAAMDHAGTDWHPGCWSAHLVAREHLARARAALVPPTDRRSA